jgi:GNAT superfamily N-acetyltransferase
VKITFRNLTPEDKEFEIVLFELTKLEPMGVPAEILRLLAENQVTLQRTSYEVDFPNSRWQIVRVDGVDCGRYISCEREEDMVLVDLAILPAFMNRGIATWIVRQLQDRARKRGVPVLLEVAKYNPRAKALYVRLGFVDIESDSPTHDSLIWRG